MIRRALLLCDRGNVVGYIASSVGKMVLSAPEAHRDTAHRSIELSVRRRIDKRIVGTAVVRGRFQGFLERVGAIESLSACLVAQQVHGREFSGLDLERRVVCQQPARIDGIDRDLGGIQQVDHLLYALGVVAR